MISFLAFAEQNLKKKNDRTPLWLEGKTVNEVLFCQEFLAGHPMVNVDSTFFTKDGIGPDENMMKKLIYEIALEV